MDIPCCNASGHYFGELDPTRLDGQGEILAPIGFRAGIVQGLYAVLPRY